jgi:hypothetical protein
MNDHELILRRRKCLICDGLFEEDDQGEEDDEDDQGEEDEEDEEDMKNQQKDKTCQYCLYSDTTSKECPICSEEEVDEDNGK